MKKLLTHKTESVIIDARSPFAHDRRRRRTHGVVSRRDVRREGKQVSEVHVNKNESLESALKRFKRQCARAGVLAEVRKREHYEKPSVKRKKKAEAARKRKY